MEGSVSVEEAVTESAVKLGVLLWEKQREALVGFCRGSHVFVSLPTGYGKSLIYALLPSVFNILNGNFSDTVCFFVSSL